VVVSEKKEKRKKWAVRGRPVEGRFVVRGLRGGEEEVYRERLDHRPGEEVAYEMKGPPVSVRQKNQKKKKKKKSHGERGKPNRGGLKRNW